MSKYLRVLRRLEKQRVLDDSGPPSAESQEGGKPPASPQVVKFPDPRPGEDAEFGFGSLLDTLRTHAAEASTPTFVLAGVSTANSTPIIAAGLAAQARLKGIRLAAASLSVAEGSRVLETHGPRPSQRSLNLSGSCEVSGSLAEWLQATSAEHDLTIIDAPPLTDCPEAAILARACSGLVLAVQPLITDRHALRTAVAGVEQVGCRLLGLVIVGGREWLPRWLRRALPAPHHDNR